MEKKVPDLFSKISSFDTKSVFQGLDATYPLLNQSITPKRDMLDEILGQQSEKEQREEEYRDNVLGALRGIEQNTASFATLITLIQKSNDKQDEVISLLSEIFEISKAKTKEEADTKYRQIMKKVGEFSGDIETIQKLSSAAQVAWTVIQATLT